MIGRVIAHRYRLESSLGEGGIGSVFKARHVIIGRTVAVKVLRLSRRGERYHRDWFLREARAANAVSHHKNIVDIYDFGDTEDGLFYLVMEYFEGVPLSHLIGQGPIELGRATHILQQTSAGLAAAHDQGVVHRDIKSDNVLLAADGRGRDEVRVIDFGLASLAHDGKLEPDGAVFGTMEYMSPEQTRGEDATPASDQYALGVLFFEMLTGRLPFRVRQLKQLLTMHQSVRPPVPSEVRKDLPPQVDRIIGRLMAKDPAERYKSTNDLNEELLSLLERAQYLPDRKKKPASSAPAGESKRPTVLILDDSKMMLTLYGALLKAAGMIVHTASSLAEFDAMVQSTTPSIILVDVMMPEIEGDQVVAMLKQNYDLGDVPVVLVSGLAEAELGPRAERAGATGYIPKGLAVEGFVDCVRGFLRPCDRQKILILDDDRMALRLYSAVLKGAGFEVHTADTLHEFDGLVREHDAAAILCDVLMPDLDGDSVSRLLRRRYDLEDVPIVLLSSLPEAELHQRTEASHADGYIVKSGCMDTFVDEVRVFLVNDVRSKRQTQADFLKAS